MNPLLILKDGWRITWRTRTLWVLTLLLIVTALPAAVLSGGFGALTSALFLQADPTMRTLWEFRLPDWPDGVWIVVAAMVLAATVVTGAMTWVLQAASMRATMVAAEGGKLSLRETLSLGRSRMISILKLSLTFGLLLAFLGVVPSLVIVIVARGTPEGFMLLNTAQTVLSPLSSILSILLLLVLMSIVIEDLRPRAAFGRAWEVFRSGWWGFLLVVVANFLFAIAFLLILIPGMIIFGIVLAMGLAINPEASFLFLGITCIFLSPVGLVLLAFVLIFSTVLYTLTYRAAAALTDRAATQTNPPGNA